MFPNSNYKTIDAYDGTKDEFNSALCIALNNSHMKEFKERILNRISPQKLNLMLTIWLQDHDINQEYTYGLRLVNLACKLNDMNMLDILILKGADINFGISYSNPLVIACKDGNQEMVNTLIYHGAIYDNSKLGTGTPLYQACLGGHVKIVETLLKHEPKKQTEATGLIAPLVNYTFSLANDLTNKVKIKFKSESYEPRKSLYELDDASKTPMHAASKTHNSEIIKILAKHGFDPNAQTYSGKTPLFEACTLPYDRYYNKKYIQAIKTLIDNGADINIADKDGETPLHLAISSDEEFAQILLENGAKVNTKDVNGQTAFHLACKKSTYQLVKLLLDHDADINNPDNEGLTPLHIACRYDNYDIIKTLIENKAIINIKDSKGLTPLSHLIEGDIYLNLAVFLLDNGAWPTEQDFKSEFSFHIMDRFFKSSYNNKYKFNQSQKNIVKLLFDQKKISANFIEKYEAYHYLSTTPLPMSEKAMLDVDFNESMRLKGVCKKLGNTSREDMITGISKIIAPSKEGANDQEKLAVMVLDGLIKEKVFGANWPSTEDNATDISGKSEVTDE